MNCVWRKYCHENVEKCKCCSFLPNLQYALSIKLFPWFIAINEVELKVLTIKKGRAICVLFSQHAHPETHPATSSKE